ncbi:MAG: hypothetical protein JJU11_02740, partial [Candidatus Sumerlaeia bacterium]|nr:hypothetical protein [Candidatus Sumerlaeia bacterium]
MNQTVLQLLVLMMVALPAWGLLHLVCWYRGRKMLGSISVMPLDLTALLISLPLAWYLNSMVPWLGTILLSLAHVLVIV